MNFKNINRTILITFIFLFACESVDFLANENTPKDKLIKESLELKSTIDTDYTLNEYAYLDYYKPLIIKNLDFMKKKSIKNTIKLFNNSSEDINPLTLFIINNNLVALDNNSILNFYDLKNFKLINTISIDIKDKNNDLLPSSIIYVNNNFYASYTNGKIISFNIEGKINWEINYNDIIKTPLKIHNESIIVILSNTILSIDMVTSEKNWEYKYKNNKSLNALGGQIVNLNNLLFFILPNHSYGQIDTLLGQSDEFFLSDKKNQIGITHFSNKLHVYNNILTNISEKKFLSSYEFGTEKNLFKNFNINNIISFKFFNNALIILDDKKNLKAINIINGNLFWSTKLNKRSKKDDEIINISNFSNSLVIFFKNGDVYELKSSNGDVVNHKKISNKKILNVQSFNKNIFLSHPNGKVSIY